MVKGDTDPIWKRRLHQKPRSKKARPCWSCWKGSSNPSGGTRRTLKPNSSITCP